MPHIFVLKPGRGRIQHGFWSLGAIVTILVSLCHTIVLRPAWAAESGPGVAAHPNLPTDMLVVVLLQSLQEALNGGAEPALAYGAADEVDPAEAAAEFVDAYAAFGVDPDLGEAAALVAIDDTLLAELTLAVEDFGLEEGLEQELIQTLHAMRADLEGLIGG